MSSSSNRITGTADIATRIVEFVPRASSLAVQSIEAAGFSVADTRILRRIADHARYATDRDVRRWKVDPGECFSFAKARTIASELGLADARTVRRAVRSAREAGILTVRQCDRVRRSYVWILPDLPAIRPTILAVLEPRTEPKRRNEHKVLSAACRRRAVKHADLPATARQRRTLRAMARERGLSDPTCHVVIGPLTVTRGAADNWIWYVRSRGGALVKRVYRHAEPATDRQIGLLRTLGVGLTPENRGAADRLITKITDWGVAA